MALRPLFCLFLSGRLRLFFYCTTQLAKQIRVIANLTKKNTHAQRVRISEIIAFDRNFYPTPCYLAQACTCELIGTHAQFNKSIIWESDKLINK